MNKVFKKIAQYFSLLKNFGLLWILRRIIYAVTQKAGLSKLRSPRGRWSQDPNRLFYPTPHFPDSSLHTQAKINSWFYAGLKYPKNYFAIGDLDPKRPAVERNELKTFSLMKRGTLRYFNNYSVETGSPILWHLHPITKTTISNELHWSSINDFGHGDIKIFGLATALLH